MADLRKLDEERVWFEVEEPNLGATFRTKHKHVRAWRWRPLFHEGGIVREDGMVRLMEGEGATARDAGAWVHPCGVVVPDNGNPAYLSGAITGSWRVCPRIGDVIIAHADGTREVCSPQRFVEEYEPE